MSEFFAKLWNSFVDSLPSLVSHLGALAALTLAFWLFTKVITVMLKPIYQRAGVDAVLSRFINRTIKSAVWLVAVIIIMDWLGIPVGSTIAVLAAGGAALALALKESLSNLAAGIVLLFTRPFKADDVIEVESFSGRVTDIRLMQTELITGANARISVPNSTMMTAIIVNHSAFETRRLDVPLSVAYRSDIDKVRALLLGLVAGDARVLHEPAEPAVLVSEHADSAVILQLRLWTAQEDYWALYFELREKAKALFDANGIEIPFPQMDVHISK